MIVNLDEMKMYLRVDSGDEDALITQLLESAEKLCMDIVRGDEETLIKSKNCKMAILYTTAYLYEHREEADYKQLMLTLRSLLFGDRRDGF